MKQLKETTSKSVIVLLIFLSSTSHGFLPNNHPEVSRSDARDRIYLDERRDQNQPETRNSARLIHRKDRVYENLYDRRSFRTGTPDERRSNEELDSREVRFSYGEPRNIRARLDNSRQRSDIRNQNREISRFTSEINERRVVDRRVEQARNMDSFRRNRNFGADLSKSDSVRQTRNARANFERTPEGYRGIRGRTDSTRYLKKEQNDIARESGKTPRQERTRSSMFRRIVDSPRYSPHSRSDIIWESRQGTPRRHFGGVGDRRNLERLSSHGRKFGREMGANVAEHTSHRSSVFNSLRDGRIENHKNSGRYVIPQRRIILSYNATRSVSLSQKLEQNLSLIDNELGPMHSKQTSTVNSWVNAVQIVLSIMMVWQILAKSSQKRHFRFINMFFGKEKLY